MMNNLSNGFNVDISDNYVSNGRVVLMVKSSGTISAARAGMGDDGMVEFASKGVSVIHVEDNKSFATRITFTTPCLRKASKL